MHGRIDFPHVLRNFADRGEMGRYSPRDKIKAGLPIFPNLGFDHAPKDECRRGCAGVMSFQRHQHIPRLFKPPFSKRGERLLQIIADQAVRQTGHYNCPLLEKWRLKTTSGLWRHA
ncbi:MAG: hypothetical protein K2Q10_06095 [Rhodospirillales bacterium]|nr:hypothetical protein [Rhodospirillales bacterium]